MLERTKDVKNILLQAGLKRSDFSVKTPYNYKTGGWEETQINIKNNEAYEIIKNKINFLLENRINVIEATINSKPYFILSSTFEKKGKYSNVEEAIKWEKEFKEFLKEIERK